MMILLTFSGRGPGKFNKPTQKRIISLKMPIVPRPPFLRNTEPECKLPGDKYGILHVTLITPRTHGY